MKNLKLLSVLIYVVAATQSVDAQEKFIKSYSYGLSFGISDVTPEILPENNQLDFLNYLYTSDDYPEYSFLNLNFNFSFSNNIDLKLRFGTYDDWAFNNLNLKLAYCINEFFGASLGYYQFAQLNNDFDSWYRNLNEGFFENPPGNFRQFYMIDRGAMFGLFFKYDRNKLHFRTDLNTGYTNLNQLNLTHNRKKNQSNYVEVHKYETLNSPALFLYPEVELKLDLFKSKYNISGIMLKTSWFSNRRVLNYDFYEYNWTEKNYSGQRVHNQFHSFKKMEIEGGIYLKF